MTENDVKPWAAWRVKRLLKIMQYKAKGLTDVQVATKEDMPSASTVSRELNSPQAIEIGRKMIDKATGMIWPLIEKQIRQIETDDLKPGARISFRGNLLNSLFKLIPQRIISEAKIESTVKGEMRHEWGLTEALGDYGDIILEAIQTEIERESRELAGQDSEQPVVPEEEPEG